MTVASVNLKTSLLIIQLVYFCQMHCCAKQTLQQGSAKLLLNLEMPKTWISLEDSFIYRMI